MSETSGEKDLPASARRRNELRERGMVTKSVDAGNTAVLAAGLFSLMLLGSGLAAALGKIMLLALTEIGKAAPFAPLMSPLPVMLNWELLGMLGAFFAVVTVSGVGIQLLQVGIGFSDKPMDWEFNRLNPLEGLQRLFSMRRLVQTILALIKIGIIAAFVYSAIKGLMQESVFRHAVNIEELGMFYVHVAWEIGWRILLALTIISLVDFGYQKWQFEKDNMMTLFEVKEELKQTEGSPMIKQRQRALMRRRSMKRMMEDMADATVVITNPTHYAIALKYIRGVTPAPIVVAKGARLIAKRLKQHAASLSIPMLENRPLARGLFKHAQIGRPIPVLYYQAVATILATLFRRGFISTAYVEGADEDHEEESDHLPEPEPNPDSKSERSSEEETKS